MKGMTATAYGKVFGFEKDGLITVLETEFGLAYLDTNTDFPLEISLGDNVEIETESYYVMNGRFFYMVTEESHIAINGWVGKWTQQKGYKDSDPHSDFEPMTIGNLLQKAKEKLGE